MRQLNNKDSTIYENEHRIVFKVGYKTHYDIGYGCTYISNYHFMVQTNTGGWADKNLTGPSKNWGNINPSAAGSYWSDVVGTSNITMALYYAIR